MTERGVVSLIKDDDPPTVLIPRVREVEDPIVGVFKIVRFGDAHVAIDRASVYQDHHTPWSANENTAEVFTR